MRVDRMAAHLQKLKKQVPITPPLSALSRSRSSIPSIPVTVDETNIAHGRGALEILRIVRPNWSKSSNAIKSKVFTDGLSNKLVGFFVEDNPEEMVIVKVFGSNTGELIDREKEIETMRILHERKCGAELYATFNNGICYEYMNGSTLDVEDCKKENIYPLVAAEMAHMHSTWQNQHQYENQQNNIKNHNNNNNTINIVKEDGEKQSQIKVPLHQNGKVKPKRTSELWEKMYQFNKLAEESMQNDPELRTRLAAVGVTPGWASGAISKLQQLLEGANMPITFCHNDLISRNIVYDEKRNRITFIDVEYAYSNYPAFDVANHFLEFAGVPELDYSKCPDKEFRLRWISEYLSHLRLDDQSDKVTVEEFNHWVDLCTPASHLFWGLWGIHQARHSTIEFDYVKYVGKRFAEYEKCFKSLTQEHQKKV